MLSGLPTTVHPLLVAPRYAHPPPSKRWKRRADVAGKPQNEANPDKRSQLIQPRKCLLKQLHGKILPMAECTKKLASFRRIRGVGVCFSTSPTSHHHPPIPSVSKNR